MVGFIIKKLILGCFIMVLFSCKTVHHSPINPFVLKDCYHFFEGKNEGKGQNYTTTRMLLKFDNTTSTFYMEYCPSNSEQVFFFAEGKYKKNDNEIEFLSSENEGLAQLKTTSIKKDRNQKINCFLPVETDTLWVFDGQKESVFTVFKEENWKKRVYWDSLFLKRYDAFTSPAIHHALVLDNYNSFGEHYDEMERPIKALLWETTNVSTQIRLKINNKLSSYIFLDGYGDYVIDFGLPTFFDNLITARLKEDSLSIGVNNYIHSKLFFDNWEFSGDKKSNGTFVLYADSCEVPLKKIFVQPK